MRCLETIRNRVAVCRPVAIALVFLSWISYPLMVCAQTGEAASEPTTVQGKTIVPIQPRAKRTQTRQPQTAGGKYLQLSRPKLGFGVSYEFTDEQKTVANTETTITNHEYNEWVEVEVDGSIYHSALLSFSQEIKLEWRQLEFEQDEAAATSSDGFLVGYDSRVSILKEKPYTLDLFALRTQDTFSSPFASRTQSDTDQYGADLTFKYRVLPTHFGYSHSETEQQGFYESTDEYDNFPGCGRDNHLSRK